MKKVLITGISGFVGSNLSPYLQNKNKFVVGVSRDFFQNQPNLVITEDVDSIIHLAGKAHDLKKTSNQNEYYEVNTNLSKSIFDEFINSDAKVFIILSSVKAVADKVEGVLTEDYFPKPLTHYGKSKLLAEQYILSKEIPKGKRVYILRPCMIHGPGNKGNLNLLYKIVSKGIPWPLGSFENKRSFCTIDNLMFIINELLDLEDIPSGVYNIADDEALSTNSVISLLSQSKNIKPKILSVPKLLINYLAKLGDFFRLPFSTENLQKLTESYVVSNLKIKKVIGKNLPISARDGLKITFQSFEK